MNKRFKPRKLRKCMLLCGACMPALAMAQVDSSRQKLDNVVVSSKDPNTSRTLRDVENMQLNLGKKTAYINVGELVINKATNNARQLYAEVPGLNIFENDGSGLQLSIGTRGLDPNRSANFNVRQDGYDISADALGYPESYYTPPAQALDGIELVKGASSLQFGTQFGGMLNFKMKPVGIQAGNQWLISQSAGSYGFYNAFASVTGQQKRISYYAYADYKRADGWRQNEKYNAINGYTHVQYALSPRSYLGAEITLLSYLQQQPGGLTDAQFAKDARQSNRSRNFFKVGWSLLELQYHAAPTDRIDIDIKVYGLLASRSAIGYRPNRPDQPDQGGERDLLLGKFNTLGLEARFLQRYLLLGKEHHFLIGARYYQGRNESSQALVSHEKDTDFELKPETDVLLHKYTFPNQNIALFTENIFRFGQYFQVSPGLRFEYIHTKSQGEYYDIFRDLAGNIINNKATAEQRSLPRSLLLAGVGASYRRSGAEFYANISQNYRSVTFSDIRTTNASFEIDPNIKDERGYSTDVGFRGKKGDIRYDVSGFYLRYADKIGEYFAKNDQLQVVRRRGNVGIAHIRGIESYLGYDLKSLTAKFAPKLGLQIYANYTFTRALYGASPVANIVDKNVEYTPAHNLKAGLNATYGKLKFRAQYSFLGEQYSDATNAVDGGFTAINGLIPAYSLVDISASYEYKKFTLGASLNNALNSVYFTRRAIGYPGPGIIPGEGRGVFGTLSYAIGQ